MNIFGLDASAVKDLNLLSSDLAEELIDEATDVGADVFCDFDRSILAGSDRPDRFISDDDIRHVFLGETGQTGDDLFTDDILGDLFIIFLGCFADAIDDMELVCDKSLDLSVAGDTKGEGVP